MPQSRPSREVFTVALEALSSGDAHAADHLVPVVYDELRKLAAAKMRRERPGHTIQPTALVHEVYLRLVGQKVGDWKNRTHFLAWASTIMRQVLAEYARSHKREKRGGNRKRVPLEGVVLAFEDRSQGLDVLEHALEKLQAIDPRKSRIVELRFFGGLTIAEVGEVLDLSHSTVEREWQFTRAWLYNEISRTEGHDSAENT